MKITLEDLKGGQRPTFGKEIPLDTFRLLRLSGFREVLGESAGPVLYMAGKSLGKGLPVSSIDDFLDCLRELKVGRPYVEHFDGETGAIRVFECMTCYGLPYMGKLLCDLENGMIAGGIEKITGKEVNATQAKSWTHGDKYCEFQVILF